MKVPTGHDPHAKLEPKAQSAATAAKQLEAFFLRRLLAEARPAGGGVDSGFANDTFKSMLDEAIADKMSAAGGIGMAQMFAKQLGNSTELPQPPVASPIPNGPRALGPVSELPELHDAPRLTLPISGARATSGYGIRHDPIQHKDISHPGFDLAATTGTPVAAAAGGTVTHAGPAGTYGNLVTIKHPAGYETRYAHLSAVAVHVGDAVARTMSPVGGDAQTDVVLEQLQRGLLGGPDGGPDAATTIRLAESIRVLALRYGPSAVDHCLRLIEDLRRLLDEVSGSGEVQA